MNDTLRILPLNLNATIPSRKHPGDAGYDLSASAEETLSPGEWKLVPTGLAIALPRGTVGLVHPRSGLAAKHAVTVLNAPGTIDEGFRGEVKVILINHGAQPFHIRVGDRIAQLVIQKYRTPEVEVVTRAEDLGETERGTNGYGSTGR